MPSPRRSTVDIRPLMAKLKAIPGAMQEVIVPLVKQEARLFVRDVVNVTPPSSKGKTGIQAKKQGEAAVARDIAKVYGTPSKVYLRLRAKAAGLERAYWKAIKEKNVKTIERIRRSLSEISFDDFQVPIGFDQGVAHQMRRKRGRVKGDQVDYIIDDPKELRRYVKKMQARVGLLASGWVRAARKLGQPLPGWVTRHGDRRGACAVIQSEERVMIIISNKVKFTTQQDMHRRSYYVLGYRQRALARRMPYVIRAALRKARLGG